MTAVSALDEILFRSKWITVKRKELSDGHSYLYTSAEWCNSLGVAILPFRTVMVNADGDIDLQFLARFEMAPAHSGEIEMGSIMGGMDVEGETPEDTAIRELIEEGGYKVSIDNMIYLGTARQSKSSDGIMHLFGVHITDSAEEVEEIGDGTLIEETGYSAWIDFRSLILADEPLMHTMYLRLKDSGYFNH